MTLEDRQALHAFLLTCHQMRQSGFGKQFSVSPTRSYRLQENTPYSTKMRQKFTHDEWQSFLIPFRKLLLNDDPGNLFKVMNILSRNGSKKDHARLREIKRRLKGAATSPGYGVQVLTEHNGKWDSLDGKKLLEKYMNSVIFHNDAATITSDKFPSQFHPFAFASLFHYVVFTYKQALRIEGAIRIRHGV